MGSWTAALTLIKIFPKPPSSGLIYCGPDRKLYPFRLPTERWRGQTGRGDGNKQLLFRARTANNHQGENRLKGPEAAKGWRKSRAVPSAHALRRTNEVQPVLLGACDQAVPRAQACLSCPQLHTPPLLCQLWKESTANGQAPAATGRQALVFCCVTRDRQACP